MDRLEGVHLDVRRDGERMSSPITYREPVGALKLWRQEIRAGKRTFLEPFDKLRSAACYETAGLEAKRQGLDLAAGDAFRAAATLLIEMGR